MTFTFNDSSLLSDQDTNQFFFFQKMGVGLGGGGGAKAPFGPHVAPPLHMIWLRKFILLFLENFNL